MNDVLDRFNWIAPHYDWIARAVFGKAIYNSQLCFAGWIPAGGRILIVGGGSGEILPALTRSNPGCRIWYVEASSGMLSLAAERIRAGQQGGIIFIYGTEDDIPEGIEFDVVITGFFLDLFPADHERAICHRLSGKLRMGGLWLVSDFIDGGKWWQKFLLWIMYRGFTLTRTIAATRLPSWETDLEATGMAPKDSRFFYGGFIKSVVYTKRD